MGKLADFFKRPQRDFFSCLACGRYSTTNEEKLERHASKCGVVEGNGSATFIDGATDEEVEDAPKKERRKFLGLL